VAHLRPSEDPPHRSCQTKPLRGLWTQGFILIEKVNNGRGLLLLLSPDQLKSLLVQAPLDGPLCVTSFALDPLSLSKAL
jgi:hypothetical protein